MFHKLSVKLALSSLVAFSTTSAALAQAPQAASFSCASHLRTYIVKPLAEDIDREKFLELLLGAVKYASDRFKLIITFRADFLAPCLEIPTLAQALQESSVMVSPKLSLDDYRQVIAKP